MLLLSSTLLLAGCPLKPTAYRPFNGQGGYEESRLQERVFRVSFRGNRATQETTVLDFLFLRCAEVTRDAGFTHFLVQEDFGRTQLDLRSTGPSAGVGMGFGGGRRGSFWGLGFGGPLGGTNTESVTAYHLAVFVIRVLTAEEARAAQGQVYDADYLLRSLDAKRQASLPPAS